MENETRVWSINHPDLYDYILEYRKEREMTQTRKFWMITGDGNSPKVRHTDRQSAVHEAERLAKANPGIEFLVLESVELIMQPTGVVRQKL
jgi:hypothetical protein